jgi:hypothetical protein
MYVVISWYVKSALCKTKHAECMYVGKINLIHVRIIILAIKRRVHVAWPQFVSSYVLHTETSLYYQHPWNDPGTDCLATKKLKPPQPTHLPWFLTKPMSASSSWQLTHLKQVGCQHWLMARITRPITNSPGAKYSIACISVKELAESIIISLSARVYIICVCAYVRVFAFVYECLYTLSVYACIFVYVCLYVCFTTSTAAGSKQSLKIVLTVLAPLML